MRFYLLNQQISPHVMTVRLRPPARRGEAGSTGRMQSAYKRGRDRTGNRQNFTVFSALNADLVERLSFSFSRLFMRVRKLREREAEEGLAR